MTLNNGQPEGGGSTTANNTALDDAVVTLISRDDQKFRLPVRAARLSELVRDALNLNDDAPADDDDQAMVDGAREVQVIRVNSKCLEKVVAFLEHYAEQKMQEIPVPLPGNTLAECLRAEQEWYGTFIQEVSRETLFDLLKAANYMAIKPLLDLACLRVTFELVDKSAEEIRQYLSLPELTPEEEAQAREEHRWIFE